MSYDLRLFTVPDHTEIEAAYERLVRREESESSNVDEWVERLLPASVRAQMQQLADSLKAWWPAFAQFEPKSPLRWIELNDSDLQIQVSVRPDSVSITMPYFRQHTREMIECVNSCIEVCQKHCGYRVFDPQLGRAVTANDIESIARAYHQMDQALPGLRGEGHGRKPWWRFWSRLRRSLIRLERVQKCLDKRGVPGGTLLLNPFNSMPPAHSTPKSEETALRILDAALTLFREEGFDSATMRAIAEKAGVATGAAYYYYPSKEAIVMDFYRRAYTEMQPKIEAAMDKGGRLETRLRELIRVKLIHFGPNRSVLRALLRNGADPKHPLSPFSQQTTEIRNQDIGWFRRILADSGLRIPRDLEPHLPGILWFLQMGVILFWVIDDSPNQARTERLLELASKSAAHLIRLSSLPLMRPLRKTALQLVAIVTEE